MRFALLAVPLLLTACHGEASVAAGPAGERNFPAQGFHAVDLRGADDVSVTVGPGFAVRATGPQAVLDRLDIHVENGVLIVGRKPGRSITGDRGAKVAVSMPAIDAASLHGAGDLAIDRAEAGSFAATVQGAGDLTIGALAATDASFDLRGAGDIKASGRTRQLTAALTGTGHLDLAALDSETATIALRGVGDIDANVHRTAAITRSGVGDVSVRGGAHCTIASSGLGNVHCG